MSGEPSRALELSAENVHDLFRYDPDSGKLFWKHRGLEYFQDGPRKNSTAAAWNTRNAGREITRRSSKGYIKPNVFGRDEYSHRIIWLLVNGDWPEGQVDHINGIKHDNRLANLRVVTNQENGMNQRRRSTNASGVQGVGWHKNRRKWQASITIDGRKLHLGLFDEFDAAVAARDAAEAEYGFHENHGRG